MTKFDAGATGSDSASGKKEERKKSMGEHIDKIAQWLVDIIAIPANLITSIMAQFITPGSSGVRILGGVGFILGSMMSADSIWQTLFRGVALFPWFQTHWIGWIGWLGLPFNLLFWTSLAIGALIQIMESYTLRGKAPEKARSEFEQSTEFKLPSLPSGNIDLTRALWGDYKKAGMRERHSGGAIALFFWVLDFSVTFGSRNPFSYTDPGQIFACLTYNMVAMFAGEIGYNIWKHTRRL